MLELVEDRGGRHVIAVAHLGRAFAMGQQFGFRQVANAFHARAQIFPIVNNRGRTGQMRRHADNRDIRLCDLVPIHRPLRHLHPALPVTSAAKCQSPPKMGGGKRQLYMGILP